MKSFKKFLSESEYDPRADINIPYQTPRDIYKIMTSRGTQNPAELNTKLDTEIKLTREQRREAWKKKKRANAKAKKEAMKEKSFEPMPVEDIAKQLGISRQRVGQILASLEDRFGKLASDEKLKELYKAMGKH